MLERHHPKLVLLVILAEAVAAAQKPTTPSDPTTIVLDAFRTHPIVALGEGQHWNLKGHALRMAFIRDPRLAGTVDDIVVEFGDARYQDVINRYVAGGKVRYDELRQVWENTTMTNTVFVMPIYEQFFRVVREVNRSLPAGRRFRVVLGDPPIDWTKISCGNEILELMYPRNAFAADLVRKEVIANRRRALLLYADGHLFRKGEETVPDWMVVKRNPRSRSSASSKRHTREWSSTSAPPRWQT